MTLGGRAAEELVFHEVTTGAANDLEKVTSTAKQMIMRFGMSEKLGPRVLGRNHDMPFLGREMRRRARLLRGDRPRDRRRDPPRDRGGARARARQVLREHMDELHQLSAILIERETIDKDQFERLLAGEDEDDDLPRRRRRRRRAGAGAGAREAPAAAAQAVPAPGRALAAAAARRRQAVARSAARGRSARQLSGR